MRRPFSSLRRSATEHPDAQARQPRSTRRNAPRRALAVLVGCIALVAIVPVAVAQAAPPGSLEGEVTAKKSGAGLTGIEVTATSDEGGKSGSATTGKAGYEINNLEQGSYTVTFRDPAGKYIFKSVPVTVKETEQTLNAELEEYATISGTATSAATGAGVGNVQVRVERGGGGEEEEPVAGAVTEANGTYTVAHLIPGSYSIQFFPPGASGYLSQATSTSLSEGEVKTVDAHLKEGGKISGTVTNAITHAGLAKIRVSAFSASGIEFGFGSAVTNANGEYTITGLVTGTYKVGFFWEPSEAEEKACATSKAPRCPPAYVTQYFANQPSAQTANPVSASEGALTGGVNAAMVPSTPSNIALPLITGTPTVGGTLFCSNGSWTGENELTLAAGSPLTSPFTYQWLRDGVPIAGATAAAYVVQAADVGHGLVCEVAATNEAGHASARSASLAVVLPAVTLSSTKLLVSGGSVHVPIACANAACVGTIELTGQIVIKTRKGKKRTVKKKTVVLGKGSYSLAPGASATIAVPLTAAAKRALSTAKSHKLSGKATVAVTGGSTVTASVVLSEKVKKKKKHKHAKKHK